MDANLLRLYEQELRYIREMGAEFARDYPKIAGRLGMEELDCADPYVERLLEGFAFLTARIQHKIEARFPDFTHQLLELVYPHLSAPVPSMAMVVLQPDLSAGSLDTGYRIPSGTALRSQLGKGEKTACQYRTAHEVTLWPLQVTQARYLSNPGMIAARGLPTPAGVRSAIQLELELTNAGSLADLPLDRLAFYLHGGDELPMWLYELLHGAFAGACLRDDPGREARVEAGIGMRQPGFDRHEALLPSVKRAFDGYRLLQEYFAFPQRYLFAELTGLQPGLRRLAGQRLEITLLLKRSESRLEHGLDAQVFRLNVTPAINLFPYRADRIAVTPEQSEFHVVPDRNRPMDLEVYRVESVTGHTHSREGGYPFHLFYRVGRGVEDAESRAYFLVSRRPRLSSARQRRHGSRTGYLGSEVFVSLVDERQAPYPADLRQLEVTLLCTNRDLPIQMAVGKGATDFTLETAAPVQAVRILAGPTRPRAALSSGETAWRLISQLSLNYLSLIDEEGSGARALRQLLDLHVDPGGPLARHVEGVVSIDARPAVRRMPVNGPICFGNGLVLRLRLDEEAFTGVGAFLLGAVLERFFAKYVSVNSFTETVVESQQRGEMMRWPARSGRREVL
ncbi:type VI secretion system baseplate subunit TssF [Halomonas campisalis]|uniref:Type VI secretion system baseplate subunit TssF n=1 Tax=Billgrantia campisalis TaxID=74661 RepID=A0ABS9P6V4_9GAMM|nr:type VI secretion system baseplate subunit TssF [Halomonas campisalis]MCG6657490.1 type VI secretion system baseplate subunit TssF [Halomonas campisalis]MDR5863163.1 type VI secretion system baseplate subunit TssF [Halomonas campisalis]